ncbi:TPA: transcriptional repressor LexA [Candidatus Berkelbacteria bacterium]|uniref:LexA repressor n=1 Tax=Berkelbacteria bacterium GW2011_GWE1_39_12 TaxID=1618337 RepID=A0A0G4B730_9BACT|nr:MAG: LexA repressor, repressor LexA [Berkelbacteria bacterium GW2011_GWE1_39_12]HBO60124.1 transcriptional repressor LexA [Candidatus Berkelbacteria bacterium]
MEPLTKRQKEIYDFIEQYIASHDYAPSYREIAEFFNLSSVATVSDHIENLKEKDYLKKDFNEARSLQLTPRFDERTFTIPLLGAIAAGMPIEAIRTNETIDIPKDMMGKNVFALKVRGDSMIDDGIFDGDYIVIEQTNSPHDGEIVVALIENEMATLKRFYREKDCIRLQPANSNYNPIRTNKVTIQGRVKGVIRKFS